MSAARIPLATPREVADYIGSTPQKLAQDRYNGRGIPFVKNGARTIRYRWSDVDAWIDANTHSPDAA